MEEHRIPGYIKDWITIIGNMNNDNTYKLAWGRAILEAIQHDQYTSDFIITFETISRYFIKYYWNQLFFFNLKQAPYINREPVICKNVRILIDEYKKINNTEIPVWYDKGEQFLNDNCAKLFEKIIKKNIIAIRENVCFRFLNISGCKLNLYEYDKSKGDIICFSEEAIKYLKNYNIVLSELLNYKWSELLETYNHQPKIVSKVKGISNSKLKRNNLKQYSKILLSQFHGNEILDFYTGLPLDKSEISVDHVIPWTFMYSDDIWNLVVTSKSNNSKKSNSIPDEKYINMLKDRNDKLMIILNDSLKEEKKFKEELLYAKNNNLVEKYYFDCRL